MRENVVVVQMKDLMWGSDWNGHELGFDDVPVVGFYTSDKLSCDFHIDMENNEIIEVMKHDY